MTLRNKTVVILSPQAWGDMLISKHHYALTLAKMGNSVYFVNPPEKISIKKATAIKIKKSHAHQNLFLIEHTLKFPFLLRFHALPLFHLLMSYHVKKILEKIGREVDIVWSFDQGNLYPLKFFGEKPFKIFHPVDEPANPEAIRAAEGAQIIISVTQEILDKYTVFDQPRHLINHGLGDDFLITSAETGNRNKVHVGVSGNLLREDIDRAVLLEIIMGNPEVVFELWGAYTLENNNIGGSDTPATRAFIKELQFHGAVLHGPVSSTQLALGLQQMDAFLICYDVKRDQSKGTNYHKIMEYLSTGKVIIANNVSSYRHDPTLVQMSRSRENNEALPVLFKKTVKNLAYHNKPEFVQYRKAYARSNTYSSHINKIEKMIASISIDYQLAT